MFLRRNAIRLKIFECLISDRIMIAARSARSVYDTDSHYGVSTQRLRYMLIGVYDVHFNLRYLRSVYVAYAVRSAYDIRYVCLLSAQRQNM